MFCVTTLNKQVMNGTVWEKGQVGEAAEALRCDAGKYNGQISGSLGFNGRHSYDIISGVCFPTRDDRDAFIAACGAKYNATPIARQLKLGIDYDVTDL